MVEFPQYDEDGSETLSDANSWRNIGDQEILGADCFIPNALVNENDNLIVLKLTSSEFTQMFSALYLGAEFAYPQTFMQIVVNFLKGLHCPPLMAEQECFEYPTYASFVQYSPENPYINPNYVPDGYLIPPFHAVVVDDTDYPDYQEFDVISPFGAFEILSNWFELTDGILPQITVMVNGAGKAFIKLLTIFNGGMAVITLDAPPNLIDIFGGIITGADNILDLNLDTISVPPETAQEVIYELDIIGTGIHTIYITFLPVIDDSSIPLRYGGGFRSIQLCNFVEQPTLGIENIRMTDDECQLQVLIAGVWTDVANWEACWGGLTSDIADLQLDLGIVETTAATAITDAAAAAAFALAAQAAADAAQADADAAAAAAAAAQSDANAAQSTADGAVTVNDAQDVIIEDHETRITNLELADIAIATDITNLDTRVSDLETSTGGDAAYWSHEFDFLVSDGGWFAVGDETWVSGSGWRITTDTAIKIAKTTTVSDQRITHMKVEARAGALTTFPNELKCSYGPETGEGGITLPNINVTVEGWVKVPNNPSVANPNINIILDVNSGTFFLRKVTLLGKGVDPF